MLESVWLTNVPRCAIIFREMHGEHIIRISFIARYIYTYEEFVFVTEATAVKQNNSDRTETQIIKRRIKKNM